jgi:iron complex outermembrane recepter protein
MNLSPFSRTMLRTGVCLAGLSAFPALSANAAEAGISRDDTAQAGQGSSVAGAEEDQADPTIPRGTGEIIVSGRRTRGQLVVDQAPLLTLDEQAIAGEGVTSIAELIAQISAQTGSARGRGGGGQPIILVNGVRIASFREFASFPPEALAKVEVFPEEVALRFGFPPDRRVINLVLKDNYENRQVELEIGAPSRGGLITNGQEIGYLRIADGGRFNLNFEVNDSTMLTEDERSIIQAQGSESTVPGDPPQASFRSLVADSFDLATNLSWAKAFIESGTSVSANINYARNQRRDQDGLNLVRLTDPAGNSALRSFGEASPLERRTSVDTLSAAASLSKPVNSFRLTSTLDSSLAESETEIDQRFDASGFVSDAVAGLLPINAVLPRALDTQFSVARSRILDAKSLHTLDGPVASLPGGDVLATFTAALDWRQIQSSDTLSGQDFQLTRRRAASSTNLVIPITSTRTGFGDAIGNVTFNAQAGLEDLSDFGLLGDWNAGLTWAPANRLDLSATYIYREVAPGLPQLGNPIVPNFNVPVFDFVRGEAVLATVITGGNPDLLAETQRDWKFAANWELPFVDNTRLTVEYIRNRSDNVVSTFPQITQAIEAAFPGRVTRDATGRLVQVDQRAVSFAETRSDRLQFTLSTRGTFGGPRETGGEAAGRGGGGAGGPTPGAGGGVMVLGGGAGGPPPGVGGQGGPPPSAGGAPSAVQREQFLAFRERLCKEDGLEFVNGLVDAIERGEDLSDRYPGFDPARFEQLLSRVRKSDGTIDRERLAQFRTQICAIDPALLSGPPGGGARTAGGGGAPGGAPSAGPPRGPGGFGGFGPGSFQGWRYFANLTHTIELLNEILIAPGLAPLDQLDGEATGRFGFPRQTSRLEVGLFNSKGIGIRMSGRYTGPTRIDGSGLPGALDLEFDDLVTVDLRLFANMGQLTGKNEGFFKDLRLTLRADNLFDQQLQVRDQFGNTPIAYQPLLIDPLGLNFRFEIRKLF